jgi:lipoate-protein ligase A
LLVAGRRLLPLSPPLTLRLSLSLTLPLSSGTGTECYPSPMTRWRLIVDDDRAGARNMARDVAILEAVEAGASPPTVRLYGWRPPCLSLGRHQGLEAADLDFCAAHGIDVVRRPTGGRAVLHHLERTYAVMAPLGSGPLPRPLQAAYRRICEGLVTAARRLGVAAELTGGEVNLQLPGPRTTVPCFEAPAGGEVVVAGRKLIGSSMRSVGGHILQHGAILIAWDSDLQAGAMGLADDSGVRSHVTTFTDELGRTPTGGEIDEVVMRGIASTLDLELVAGQLTAHESRREDALVAEFAISPP